MPWKVFSFYYPIQKHPTLLGFYGAMVILSCWCYKWKDYVIITCFRCCHAFWRSLQQGDGGSYRWNASHSSDPSWFGAELFRIPLWNTKFTRAGMWPCQEGISINKLCSQSYYWFPLVLVGFWWRHCWAWSAERWNLQGQYTHHAATPRQPHCKSLLHALW